MTDPKALIAEAREFTATCASFMAGEDCPNCILLRRLADALEEATPPEGWEVERYTRRDGVSVKSFVGGTWIVAAWNRVPAPEGIPPYFDTAREAMAALDAQKAPPPSEG